MWGRQIGSVGFGGGELQSPFPYKRVARGQHKTHREKRGRERRRKGEREIELGKKNSVRIFSYGE